MTKARKRVLQQVQRLPSYWPSYFHTGIPKTHESFSVQKLFEEISQEAVDDMISSLKAIMEGNGLET
jgi:hypothetical protein